MKRSEIEPREILPYELDYTKLELIAQSVAIYPSGDLNIRWEFRCGNYKKIVQFHVTQEEIEKLRNWPSVYSKGLIQ